jgi:hypothetical protein
MSDWLLDHRRMLEIVVGIGFGASFSRRGSRHLIAYAAVVIRA